jgi:hypothetical protein
MRNGKRIAERVPRIVLHLLSGAAALLAQPWAAAQPPTDIEFKARLSLAVARFVEFPDRLESAPIHICLAHRDAAIVEAFLKASGQPINGKIPDIVASSPSVVCNILYVDQSAENWRSLIAEQRNAVLTISDKPGFLASGGMIELVFENDSLRFDVNLVAVRQKHIRLPAQVLKLARRVQE